MLFKENLNRICKERGTSLTPVMTELGYSSSKATAINNGQIPKEETLIELARHLQCSVMDFFMDNPDIEINQNNNNGNITNQKGSSENTNSNNTTNNYYSCEETSINENEITNVGLVFHVIDRMKLMTDNELRDLLKYAEYISHNNEGK